MTARPALTPGFGINQAKGFHMKFQNGWTISVQFGPGNYCNNQSTDYTKQDEPIRAMRQSGFYLCDNAEVGIWHNSPNYKHTNGGGMEILGWQTPIQVAAHIQEVSNRSPWRWAVADTSDVH